MFKSKLIFFSVLVFLIINSLYFWEGALGIGNMLLWLCLFVAVVMLFFGILRQVFFAIKESFKNRARLYKIGIVLLLLILVLLRPNGIINYPAFESKSIFVATREGSANCTTTLTLKESGRYRMRSICFGISDNIGFYTIHKDTIRFSDPLGNNKKSYDYAVLNRKENSLYFKNGNNTVSPIVLNVIVNKIKVN